VYLVARLRNIGAALPRRVCKGHATPGWVLQSNLRLLYANHQEISELRDSGAAEHPKQRSPLLNIKERQKPQHLKKNILASFSARSPWLFCNLLSGSRHTNKRLEAG
jgi:hypothetical protein